MSSNRLKPVSDKLVWIDCEMTGLNPQKDVILEIAVIVTDGKLNTVAEGPNLIVHQENEVLESMGHWCREHHGASGLTRKVRESCKDLATCEKEIVDFLELHTPKGVCPLAGNSVGQDAKFLEIQMPKVMEHVHYRIVDVSTIKELVKRWYPKLKVPGKKMKHRALDDIKESIEELKFYREKIFISS